MFNETQTGFASLGDYVHSGDVIYWAGNVSGLAPGGGFYIPGVYSGNRSWSDTFNQFLSLLRGEGFGIQKSEENADAGSIAVNVFAPTDFNDLQDVGGLIAGIAGQAGFQLRASNVQAGQRNLASPQPSPWTNPLGTAGEFWGSEISTGATSFWKGITGGDPSSLLASPTNLALLAVIGLGVLLIVKR